MALYSPRDFGEIASPEVAEELRAVSTPLLVGARIAAVGEMYGVMGRSGGDLVPLASSASLARGPIGGRTKRRIDILIAGTALVLLSPVLLVVAALIKLQSDGSVIYRHRRIGFGGRPFECLKFRTMVENGDVILRHHLEQDPVAAQEWLRTRKLVRDPRITRLGYFLRKTSLDELPQLINILTGDMSCVGPRPVVADELKLYGDKATDYLRARPGVTGLWQVSGRGRSTYEARTDLDAKYVREWSLSKDLLILLRTLPAVMKTHHAA